MARVASNTMNITVNTRSGEEKYVIDFRCDLNHTFPLPLLEKLALAQLKGMARSYATAELGKFAETTAFNLQTLESMKDFFLAKGLCESASEADRMVREYAKGKGLLTEAPSIIYPTVGSDGELEWRME